MLKGIANIINSSIYCDYVAGGVGGVFEFRKLLLMISRICEFTGDAVSRAAHREEDSSH